VIEPIVYLNDPELIGGLLDKQLSYHRVQKPDEFVVVCYPGK
jgi:hypothetical protein